MGRIIIDRHAYAPELNKTAIKRGGRWHWIKTPGVDSIRAYRDKNKPAQPCIVATVRTVYTNPAHKSLERTYTGRVDSRADALRFAAGIRARNQGGPIFGGGFLEPARVEVKTRIVG